MSFAGITGARGGGGLICWHDDRGNIDKRNFCLERGKNATCLCIDFRLFSELNREKNIA